MNPTDHRHILGNQMELALPPIAVEAVVIERMMAVIAENSSNVALCGDSIMLLQQKVESLTSAVFALVEAYRRQAGPKEAAAAHAEATALDELAEPPGHAGYTVKEFAALTKRSKSYVYRLIFEKQVTKNMAALTTPESLLKMRMAQAGKRRRQRPSKWT